MTIRIRLRLGLSRVGWIVVIRQSADQVYEGKTS